METQVPYPKRGHSPPIFGPCLLWQNCWMDQDATWYGGRPWPRPLSVGWGPSSPSSIRGHSPKFSAHFYCGQTAGWIKMPLGMKVGLGLGHVVLDGDAASGPSSRSPKRRQSPQFSAHVYCGQTAGWIQMALGMEVDSTQATLC